jgi:hypothetical protein
VLVGNSVAVAVRDGGGVISGVGGGIVVVGGTAVIARVGGG